ncbi:hypothetical protein ACH4SK_37515 [Streptomyces inhibens]|uniref:hypothetical protein n=1 Tax=Streptomyces inhibens TaxID=2293571 RepID=UPI0037B407EE
MQIHAHSQGQSSSQNRFTTALKGGALRLDLVAPELAASINAGIQPVTPSTAAEVYALAGTLWTCITGRWPLDYAAAGIDPHRLAPAELRAHLATGRIPLDTAAPWPKSHP